METESRHLVVAQEAMQLSTVPLAVGRGGSVMPMSIAAREM